MKNLKLAISGVVFIGLLATAGAAPTTHTLQAVLQSSPNGANSTCSITLKIDPNHDTDIAGFDIWVGYDDTQISFVSVTDNTGQPFAGVEYLSSAPQPFSGAPYVNRRTFVGMSTLADVMRPIQNLGLLTFQTTPGYSDPNNKFYIYIGPTGNAGPNDALVDGNFEMIPTVFESLAPPNTSVQDWAIY